MNVGLLTVVVPAFNEERTIAETLARVRAVDLGPLHLAKEIIVVSDGSTDATAAIARTFADTAVVELKPNQGKGAAIRAGLRSAHGELLIVQDADLEYDPDDYPALLRPLTEGRASVVYGSRLRARSFGPLHLLRRHPAAGRLAYAGGRVITIVTNLLFRTHLTDEPTGYKCFRTDLLRACAIESNGFEWEPEITAKLARCGVEILEVPISYHPRSVAEGKKIGWRDGVRALLMLVRQRFGNSWGESGGGRYGGG